MHPEMGLLTPLGQVVTILKGGIEHADRTTPNMRVTEDIVSWEFGSGEDLDGSESTSFLRWMVPDIHRMVECKRPGVVVKHGRPVQ